MPQQTTAEILNRDIDFNRVTSLTLAVTITLGMGSPSFSSLVETNNVRNERSRILLQSQASSSLTLVLRQHGQR